LTVGRVAIQNRHKTHISRSSASSQRTYERVPMRATLQLPHQTYKHATQHGTSIHTRHVQSKLATAAAAVPAGVVRCATGEDHTAAQNVTNMQLGVLVSASGHHCCCQLSRHPHAFGKGRTAHICKTARLACSTHNTCAGTILQYQ
jgi:hypothetical protein